MKNRIGIIGGGQLGRMMTPLAKELGFTVTVVDPTINSPAAQLGANQIIAPLTDEKATRKLAEISDFLTFEIENINTDVLRELEKKGVKVNPSSKTLDIIKDKLAQKEFLKKNGISTSEFLSVIRSGNEVSYDSNFRGKTKKIDPLILPQDEVKDKIEEIGKVFGYPFLIKSRYGGYDGRGNYLVKNKKQIIYAIKKLGSENLYAEKYVSFVKELAIMIGRSSKGEVVAYPVVETIHKNNICHIVKVPAQVERKIAKKAELLAKKVMKHLGGAGVFGIEMFLTSTGKVLINEIAPRIHNSGHYTTEACVTSQFEQHIRAITGMPLGSTAMRVPVAVMINILGERLGETRIKGLEKVLAMPGVYVHMYGKAAIKPGRKMGHITVIDTTMEKAYKRAVKARMMISV